MTTNVTGGISDEVKRMLMSGSDVSSGPKSLIIDDNLVALLSQSIQGSQLKYYGIDKWFRLSKCTDFNIDGELPSQAAAPWSIVVCLSGYAALSTLKELVRCAVKIHAASKRFVVFHLCFVPRRSCAQVNYLLLSIRQGLGVGSISWQEDGECLILGRLKIHVIDVPLDSYNMRSSIITLCNPQSYIDLHTRGDAYHQQSLMECITRYLDSCDLANVMSIIGLGTDGRIIAKKIVTHLSFRTSADANAERLVTAKQNESGILKSGCLEWTDFKSRPLISPIISTMSIAAKLATSETAGCGQSHRILPDSILNRCILRYSSDYTHDVKFVEDEIRESGLTRRSRQPSFKIRLPDLSTRYTGNANSDLGISTPNIKSIIVIDRAIDWISPLLTPFTYEAMLDLQWGIENCNIIRKESNGQSPAEIINLSDGLFLKIRDLLLCDVGAALHAEALKLQAQSPVPHNGVSGSTGSVSDMHSALLHMREHEKAQKDLGAHVNLVSDLVRGLWKSPAFYTILKTEDDILNCNSMTVDALTSILCQLAWRNAPIFDVMRLTMLVVLIRGPACSTRLADVRGLMTMVQRVLHALCFVHGSNVYERWHNFETTVFKNSTFPSPAVARSTSSSSSAFSFVHSGFTPLSVEVLEAIVKQRSHPVYQACGIWRHKILHSDNQRKEGDILLIFPHHVTYSELAAIRSLSKAIGRKFVIITSSIGGYRTLLMSDRSDYTGLLQNMIL